MIYPKRIKDYIPILGNVSLEQHNHLLMIWIIFWTTHYMLLVYYYLKIYVWVEYKYAASKSDISDIFELCLWCGKCLQIRLPTVLGLDRGRISTMDFSEQLNLVSEIFQRDFHFCYWFQRVIGKSFPKQTSSLCSGLPKYYTLS